MVSDAITPGYCNNKNTMFLQPKSKTKAGETALPVRAARRLYSKYPQKSRWRGCYLDRRGNQHDLMRYRPTVGDCSSLLPVSNSQNFLSNAATLLPPFWTAGYDSVWQMSRHPGKRGHLDPGRRTPSVTVPPQEDTVDVLAQRPSVLYRRRRLFFFFQTWV